MSDKIAFLGAGLRGDMVAALIDRVENIVDFLADGFRCDAMRFVPGFLLGPAAVGLVQRILHRGGDGVGIEDDPAVDIPCRPSDGLDQRGLRPQIAFLVGIEDSDKGTFRNVQPLAEQVDADQNIEHTKPQVAHDLDPLQRVDIGMQIAHADAGFIHIFRQRLCHLLGQGGDQHPLALCCCFAALGDDVIHLAFRRAHDAVRIGQAGGPHHLFGKDAAGALHLPGARGRGNKDGLWAEPFPLLEFQRPVIHAGRQAEAIFRKRALAREVAFEHGPDLRHGDVAFIDDQKRVLRKILEQGRRWLARSAPRQIAGIVLDAGAGPGGLDHLDIELRALLDALRLQQLALFGEFGQPLFQLGADQLRRLLQRRARRHIV